MIEAHYNPITGQSFKITDTSVPYQKIADIDAQAAIEQIQKQKMANSRKNNCKNK